MHDLEREYRDLCEFALETADRAVGDACNALLTARATAICDASKVQISGPVIIGCCHRTFPAVTAVTKSGKLILVSDRFVTLAHNVGWVLAAVVPADSAGRSVPAALTRDQAVTLLRALITDASKGQVPPTEVPPESLPGSRAAFAGFLAERVIDFTIAHEIAHVVQGHLDRPLRPATSKSGRPLAINLYSWADEAEADVVGSRLARAVAGPGPLGVELGATIVFEIIETAFGVRETRRRAGPVDLRDVGGLASHPPAAGRRATVITDIDITRSLSRLPELDFVVDLMARTRNGSHHD